MKNLILIFAIAVCICGCTFYDNAEQKISDSNGIPISPSSAGVSGSYKDSRDGRIYNVVKIGAQIWMAENLNYNTGSSAVSYCYDDDTLNCKIYGRLYTWDAASIACPSGWTLPTKDEWDSLETYSDYKLADSAGYVLKASSGWENDDYGNDGNGSDLLKFTAFPGGYFNVDDGYVVKGKFGFWWSSTETNVMGADAVELLNSSANFVFKSNIEKIMALSVRCIKK